MRLFGTRTRPDIDKVTDVTGEIRDFVRRQDDFHADPQPLANNPASLLQRVAGTPEQEVDQLIAELQALREKLQSEGARVQRRIVDYATLNQSAMQSARVISECLQDSMLRRRPHLDSSNVSPRFDAAKPGVIAQTLSDRDDEAANWDGAGEVSHGTSGS